MKASWLRTMGRFVVKQSNRSESIRKRQGSDFDDPHSSRAIKNKFAQWQTFSYYFSSPLHFSSFRRYCESRWKQPVAAKDPERIQQWIEGDKEMKKFFILFCWRTAGNDSMQILNRPLRMNGNNPNLRAWLACDIISCRFHGCREGAGFHLTWINSDLMKWLSNDVFQRKSIYGGNFYAWRPISLERANSWMIRNIKIDSFLAK